MTRQEAITKIENYKNKMRVIGAECKFEFDVRKDGAGDAMIVITNLYAEPGDEILIPPFVAYIDADAYESAHSGRGCCRDYTIIYPNGCDVFRGDRDNKRFILRFSAGIAVNETHPYVSSEGGVLLSKEKKRLYVYPMYKRDDIYKIPECVCCIEEGAFDNTHHLERLYIHENVTEIKTSEFPPATWIEVDENNAVYKSVDGSLYSKDGKVLYHLYTKGEGVVRIEEGTVQVTIPKSYGSFIWTHSELYLPETIEPMGDLVVLLGMDKFKKFIIPEKLRSFIEEEKKIMRNIKENAIYVEYY